MQRPITENEKHPETDSKKTWSVQKKQAIAAVIIALIALLIVPVLAWLYYQRTIQTVTKINEPHALIIGAGDAQAISQLELSDIDVSEKKKYKDVVFCVYSYQRVKYQLQLAHTTNIGFTYTIYPAVKGSDGGSIIVPYLGQDYSFNINNKVAGKYLNQQDGIDPARALPAGTYHDKTYAKENSGAYDHVQLNAEPLYWKTTSDLTLPASLSSGHYIDYYVLRISWDGITQNNKETDLVYLMAESKGAADTTSS